MKKLDKIVQSAIAATIALLSSSQASWAADAAPQEMEKCYGIVKAGMNDCNTSTQKCASSATKDNQKDAFILLPKGTCQKIVGGSLSAEVPNQEKPAEEQKK